MTLKKAIKELRRMMADDADAYNRGFEAAMLHLDSAFDKGDQNGYERGFKDGYDIGHGVASGTIPQPAINEPFALQHQEDRRFGMATLSEAYVGDSGDEDDVGC